MVLKSIVVQFTTENQEIRGSFKALVSSTGVDVLIIGSKKSSMLFKLTKVTIKSITIKHIGNPHEFDITHKNKTSFYNMIAGERILIETYRPENKQQAYFILTALYIKYKNKKSIIDTELFCVTEHCAINDLAYLKEKPEHTKCDYPIGVKAAYIPDSTPTRVGSETYLCKKDVEPKLHSNNTMAEFLNELSEGRNYERKQNYWKQGYSGQLINSG